MRIFSPEEVRAFPPIVWLVQGVLPMTSLGVLFGESGVGKTFVGLDLAHSISEGVRWFGRRVRQGDVVYVMAGEGVGGLRSRMEAWELARGTRVTRVHYLTDAVQLHQPASVQRFLRAVKARTLNPVLIVFDTLARCFAGGDEDGVQDMGLVIQSCDDLRRKTGAAVLLVHHTGHPDPEGKPKRRPRGSSSLPAAADTEIGMRQDEETKVIWCEKQKDAERFHAIRCVLQPVRRAGKSVSLVPVEENS